MDFPSLLCRSSGSITTLTFLTMRTTRCVIIVAISQNVALSWTAMSLHSRVDRLVVTTWIVQTLFGALTLPGNLTNAATGRIESVGFVDVPCFSLDLYVYENNERYVGMSTGTIARLIDVSLSSCLEETVVLTVYLVCSVGWY